MKTSKKLLSFFLAVVMAVTSCSVGFVAFAQENNKSIWQTDSLEANDAFDALDDLASEYLPSLLLGIGAIGDPLMAKKAAAMGKDVSALTKEDKEKIANDATIQDVLGVLQPMLLELLAKKSQDDFAKDKGIDDPSILNYLNADNKCSKCGKYWADHELTVDENDTKWCPDGCANVDKEGNKSSTIKGATMSYYTILTLCNKYKNDTKLSADERKQLSDWADVLAPLAALAATDDDKLEPYMKKFTNEDPRFVCARAPLYNLENFDFGLTADDQPFVDRLIDAANQKLAALNIPSTVINVDSFASVIYYMHGAGRYEIYAHLLYRLITQTISKVEFKETYDVINTPDAITCNFDDITPANCYDLLLDELFTVFSNMNPDCDSTDYALLLYGECEDFDEIDFAKSYFKAKVFEGYTKNILIKNYYNEIIRGIAADEGVVSSADKYDDYVADLVAHNDTASDASIFSEADIKSMSIALDKTRLSGYEAENADSYFGDGTATFKDGSVQYTVTLPAVLKGTQTADYFRLVTGYSKNNTYKFDLIKAFFSNVNTVNDYQRDTATNELLLGSDNLPILGDGNTSDATAINKFLDDAKTYAFSKVLSDAIDFPGTKSDPVSGQYFIIDIEKYLSSKIDSSSGSDSSVTLTDEQIAILNGNYDFTGDIGTYILNKELNGTVGGLLGTIEDIINGLLATPISLGESLTDIWSKLMESPVGTIVDLLPVLVVIIDELLLPFLANGQYDNDTTDEYYGFLYGAIGNKLLDFNELGIGLRIDTREWSLANGSYIGINQVGWDLNELLPALMHWLTGDMSYAGFKYYSGNTMALVDINKLNDDGSLPDGVSYADIKKDIPAADLDSADPRHYVVKDTNGNPLTRVDSKDAEGKEISTFTYKGTSTTDFDALMKANPDSVFNCYITYESDVPVLTGIYIADKALAGAEIADIHKIITNKLNDDIERDKLTAKEIAEKEASNAKIGAIAEEAVSELAALFTMAIDEFIATPEYRDAARYDNNKNKTGTGLNNIFVALPQLFDIMENIAADKYGISENAWIYCYDGKFDTNANGSKTNATLEVFKSFAASTDSNKKYDIFDCFAEIFIENWMNAILSLVNNVVSTDNKISNELPIIAGLLNAVGGFGEKSILTDIFNSVFQITRDSEFSFAFDDVNSNPNNKFTGLSKNNAYLLIANIPRLAEVITNLIDHFKGDGGNDDKDDKDNNNNSNASNASTTVTTPKVYAPKKAGTPKADASKYTNKDLSNATDLINNLDKLLSSLLSDATLNDFSLNEVDNIFAGLITFLSNYLGNDFSDDADSIVRLLNSYVYYITGCETHKATAKHDVDDKKVYTNDALTGLVVETYTLIEKLAANLLNKFDDPYDLGNKTTAKYNLLVEAIDGLISPDAVSIRLKDDYSSAAKTIAKYNSWQNMAAKTSRGDYKVSINWGVKDKETFYEGLASSLRIVTSLLGVLLIDTGWYDTVVTPVLGALCTPNGIKLTPYSTLVNDKNKTGYYDKTLIAVLDAVSKWINTLLDKPATTLIKSIQGIAGILDDKNGATIASIVKGALNPLAAELNGLANVVDSDISNLTPTGAKVIRDLAGKLTNLGKTDKNNALVNIKIGKVYKNSKDEIVKDYRLPLSGANLIPIINTYLAEKDIALKKLNWNKISTAKTPAAALVYVLEYVLELVLDILDIDLLDGITAKDLLGILNRVLEASDSPTMAYWTFAQYLQERKSGFKYPAGITADMAIQGVAQLDSLVANIFPLLSTFGVDLGDSLQAVLDNKLFTNEILTKLATALYGALDGLDPTIKAVINGLGIATSTKDVAKLLTDKSYGTTYTAAAKAIRSKASWSDVKNVNWGFKDGAANAQQGFINALVAILRPVNDILSVFLNEGTLNIDDKAYDIICGITIPRTTTNLEFKIGDRTYKPRIAYAMKNGVLAVSVREDPSVSKTSRSSTLKLDFKSLKNLDDLKLEGTNAYNSAIIPLLEALQCKNIKTYAQYQKDVSKAKDNLLLDVLNPLLGSASSSFLSKLVAKPATTLTTVLPTLAMFLDGGGLVQLVMNILAPVTYAISDGKNISVEVNDLIEALLGNKLEYAIIPLVNLLLADTGITIPEIDWAFLASLGTPATYTSKATGLNGKFLTGKTVTNVDEGKVLITVLRFVADTLITNIATIKNLVLSIDAVAKNDLISSIVKSVFNTIATASKDQLVSAIFYLLASNPTNAFWDYTSYKTGDYSFSYPGTVDVDFLKNLPPMLDGVISGFIDLNGLINEKLFTDNLISKLATGLYGAIEGVKINDNTNLAQLLAQTDIDFTTSNVASLLTNERYGQKYESAAAVISAAGSWKNVNADNLKWGVTDRDSFFHALVAVLRPIYGVLDVLINDGYLGLFDLVRLPGSNGYSSSIVPVLEAFSAYNIKTQYQYRQDMSKEYDAILLDIINPLWDKVEDILNAPLQTITSMIPNLALFIGNDGLCQIIDNLLTPVSALADAIRPIVDLNDLLGTVLKALKVDLNGILGKIGVTNFKLDLYDLNKTLKQILGADAIIPLVNSVLGLIKIKGNPLGIKLNDVDWLQLASHGTTIISASQAATYGARIFVEGDSSETLIAILRYLIATINTGENFNNISSLIGGLIGGADDNISGMISDILGMLTGDTDQVISDLVELLKTLA